MIILQPVKKSGVGQWSNYLQVGLQTQQNSSFQVGKNGERRNNHIQEGGT